MNKRSYVVRYAVCSILACAMIALVACNPEAKAVSGPKVEIRIEPIFISSGCMRISFTSSQEAYFYVGVIPAAEAPDTTQATSVRAFMNRKLDVAYADYLYWRYDILEQEVPYVAEFATHSLQYSKVDYTFPLLTPNTNYMIYAFVVDAKSNKPDGRLFVQFVSTEQKSMFADTRFEYRVRGYWDYIYPLSANGDIYSYAPWVGMTADSAELAQEMQEMSYVQPYSSAKDYFLDIFGTYKAYDVTSRILYGIYVHKNDGVGDGSSSTLFEHGHTYYTALALMDGYLDKETITIYKFHWDDETTSYFFRKEQNLSTDW